MSFHQFLSSSHQGSVPAGINVVQLLGRAGATPKIAGPEERPFVMFPLATNYAVKTKEEDGSGRLRFGVINQSELL